MTAVGMDSTRIISCEQGINSALPEQETQAGKNIKRSGQPQDSVQQQLEQQRKVADLYHKMSRPPFPPAPPNTPEPQMEPEPEPEFIQRFGLPPDKTQKPPQTFGLPVDD